MMSPASEALVGRQLAAEKKARRTSPEAVEAREASTHAYENLNAESAARLAIQSFPALVDQSNGPLSSLPPGQKISGYLNPYTAMLTEEDGQRALAVSSVPVAVENSPTTWKPIGLNLHDAGSVFEPVSPLVSVRAPKVLKEGISLPSVGVIVTPVDEKQESLGGQEGTLDGSASVFYANTQTDSDTLFKPSTFGFAIDTLLRSANSPERISFRIGLPENARLVSPAHSLGKIRVVKEGTTIATIPVPKAFDATGAMVPVSVNVSGDILTLTVVHKAGEYLFPINVDPEFNIGSEGLVVGNWHHGEAAGGGFTFEDEGELRISREAPFPKSDWAYWATETKGDSKIYAQEFTDFLEPEESEGGGTSPVVGAWLELFKEGGERAEQVLSGTPYAEGGTVCAIPGCSEGGGSPGNIARFEITSLESSAEATVKEYFAQESEAWYGGSITATALLLSQPKETHSKVKYNTASNEITYVSGGKSAKTTNALYGGQWIGQYSGAFEYMSEDAGLGVSGTSVEVFKAGKWEVVLSKNYLSEEKACIGVQCAERQNEVVQWPALGGHVVNGENRVRVAAHDPMPGTSSTEFGEGETTLDVDTEAPHGIKINGVPLKGKIYEIGEAEAHIKAEGTDGGGSVLSSGIKSLGLEIDGKGFGPAGGSCTPGPCTASTEWSINGAELGVGHHILTVVATDNAGNISTENFELSVYHASPIAMGPGSVNPESGDFALEADDVDLGGGMGPLTVSRHFDSRNPTEGAEGPLGPQWTISLGSVASLEVLPDGSVMIVSSEGLTLFSKTTSGAFEAPPGDSNLALVLKGSEYILSNKDKGTSTIFTQPAGSSEWMATVATGTIATDTMTDEYETIEVEAGKNVVRPKLELAPHPSATCVLTKTEVKWEAPCRGLILEYAETTTAKSETEWGNYKYRLKEIIAVTYNSTNIKEPHQTPVAKYEYDSKGKLRVEWDPRVSPALKTVYGYNNNTGDITAISPPGQEPWLLTYGASVGDTSIGRLISISRPSASTSLGGTAPTNTVIPTLSNSKPVVGTTLTVTTGTWSNSPEVYSYQWYDCNSGGNECKPIGDATNPTYHLTTSDGAHTIIAEILATNAGGTGSVSTAATSSVPAREEPRYESGGHNVESTLGVTYYGSSIYLFVDHLPIRCLTSHGSGALQAKGAGGVSLRLENCSAELGSCSVTKTIELDLSTQVVYGFDEEAQTTPHMFLLFGITLPQTLTIEGGSCPVKGSGLLTGSILGNVTKESEETSSHEIKLEETLKSQLPEQYQFNGSEGRARLMYNGVYPVTVSGALTVSLESAVYSEHVGERFTASAETPAPPSLGSTAVTTIEYGVPVSGSGAPAELSTKETEKWGQTDDPVEATAIFPPDEPMGWPAKDYTRATVYYFDSQARTVNIRSPSGAISTSEYNEDNNTVRSLSAVNRVTALKETCESKEKCKSAEASRLLDSESKYGNEGTELEETTGPQHSVKLAGGSEVLARNHVKYFYDEGAPEGEEHGLVTRTVASAMIGNKEEEPRTTRTYYSGQKGLGWKLREPTSVVVNPEGLAITHTTVYNETTGNVVETKTPGGTVETVYPPAYSSSFGSLGSGSGQLNEPEGTAVNTKGDIWVTDSNNKRIEEFSPEGTLIAVHESKGTGEEQLTNPWGITINQTTGNIYVTDNAGNRITELNSSGGFIRTIGSTGSGHGNLSDPLGIAIDSHGNIFVADSENNRVEEFNEGGNYVNEFGKVGTGNGQFKEPAALTFGEGELYVVDRANDRIEEFTPGGAYLSQFGSDGTGIGQLKEPRGITTNPATGVLYVSDAGNERVQEFSPAGKPLAHFGFYGSGTDAFHSPTGIALNATGELYIADVYNDRVDEWALPGAGGVHMTYSSQTGSEGYGNGQFYLPYGISVDGRGNIWVSDYYNDRVQELSATGQFIAAYGSKGSGNGQFEEPTGVAVNQGTGNVYVSDCGNHRVEELNEKGEFIRTFGSAGSGPGQFDCPAGIKIDPSGNVWVADRENNRIEEFTGTGTFIATYGSYGSGNGQFKEPRDIAFSGGNMYVVDYGNDRVQELSMTGGYIRQFGREGEGSGEFNDPRAITSDPAGNLYVLDQGNDRVEEFSNSGTYLTTFGSGGSGEGQLSGPDGLAINAAGDVYITDSGADHIETWAPANQAAHDTRTIYYTAKGEAEVAECRNHPEWVELVCQTMPAAQPETAGLPALPVTTIEEYNIWDEPELVKETFKERESFREAIRYKTTTYDSAGRPVSNSVTSEMDKPVATVEDKYDSKLGILAEEITKTEGKEEIIKKTVNTLGQLEQYKDADGNVTTYKHDIDGRTTEVANTIEAGGKKESTYQKFTYESPSGFLTKLEDSGAGTFKATRNIAGQITTETYPNAMTATDTYSATGEPIGIRYEKTAHCEKTCPETWFKEAIVPTTHGETFERANTLTTDAYGYDPTGRLTEVHETPTGKGCVTRLYGYDEESDRTSLTSRPPTAENKCATEGGTMEVHKYDPADRLIDNGVEYEIFGNTTKLPGADAGGPEMEIKTEYYVDNQAASQKQDGKIYKYSMDPSGRVRETKTETEGKPVLETITHYAGPGSAIAWTNEEEAKKWTQWTRDIPGIDGTLTAIQSSNGKVTLQIHDLQGDVVETALDLETETKVLTSYNSTEFGVPLNGTPPTKYTWLGAEGVSSESSGLITQDGVTYVPQTGRPLQTQGIAPPTAENKATAYISMIAPGVEASAVSASTQQVANAEQAKSAVSGKSEAGEGGGGGSNGRAPIELSETLEGGCSGSNACAASYTTCALRSLFGEPFPADLWLAAVVKCTHKVSGIQMEIQIWAWTGSGENYKVIAWNGDRKTGEAFYNKNLGGALISVVCGEAWHYKAWVWGYAWGPGFWFGGGGQTSEVWTCAGNKSEGAAEFGELIAGK